MTKVIHIKITETSYRDVAEQVHCWAKINESRYVCAANVHVVMEAYDAPEFAEIVNDADLVTPDGMPLVCMMRLKGAKTQNRVYGPTLMLHVLDMASKEQIPVGFYGSTPQTIESLVRQMQKRYQGLNVVFSYSPPYHALSAEEDEALIKQIHRSEAQILFVGLGCPKQEIWMANHRGKVKSVMIGVGAAFDFHAGVKPQAPGWMQNIGLEWLFRLLSEPHRLWKRYLYQNPRFVVLAITDLLRFRKGME